MLRSLIRNLEYLVGNLFLIGYGVGFEKGIAQEEEGILSGAAKIDIAS